ncbi:ArnT family glycosyltransferase [Anaerosinus massiliensis]|uniref:ArnT family glycosyltransferase n=1 Tax=Massilibacillus massiliensis TaxID=1806837 RepID=UPI000A5D63D3|nr:glycosyltransferase family 39 protein [Massilibacillus massiliensis]
MFTFLGIHPLLDPDEPVYAETAREMLQFQDFISPRIYGEFWYDKPPMYYWLVAAAFSIFGQGEFAARVPSAFFAVSGAVLVYLSGRKLFNERAGLLSALVLVTSFEYFYLGNAAVTDMTLTFFMTAALLSFLHQKYNLLYVLAALAVVTKGPVAIFFCGLIISLYLGVTGSFNSIKTIKIIRGSVVFALIALPWYGVMYYLHGMTFIETFLGFHNVTRFLQPEHVSGAVWYYYIPVLLLGFFPWSACLVQAFLSAMKEKGQYRNVCIFLEIWIFVIFLFFSISQTKLVSYILPIYPPLALLIGYYFDKIWTEKRYKALISFAGFLGLIVAVLSIVMSFTGIGTTVNLISVVKGVTIILSGVAILVLFQSFRHNFRAVFTTTVLGMIIFLVFLMKWGMPILAPAFSVKAFADQFQQQYSGQAPVYIEKFYRPGFMYYTGIAGFEFSEEQLRTALSSEKGRAYFVMKKTSFESLPSSIQSQLRLLVDQEDVMLLFYENNEHSLRKGL